MLFKETVTTVVLNNFGNKNGNTCFLHGVAVFYNYANKLIRQYIPKKESFDKYNKQDVKQVQYELNKRPREKLNFETPKKTFLASLLNNVAFDT